MSRKMEEREWLPQAEEKLSGGRNRARGDHDCGDPGSLMLTRDGNEWGAYCHRCGAYGKRYEQESPAVRAARMQSERQADDAVRFSIDLPDSRVYALRDWPNEAGLWFYKMGLSPSMIEELGMYWCPELGRVVLPIMEDGHAVFWMARSHKRQPKWLAPQVPKRGLVAAYGQGKGDTIVLTEDPLSAYKVGKVTEAWSLLGTKLHPRQLVALAHTGKRIATWLDDDQGRRNGVNPGQEAAATVGKQLSAFGLEVRNITSDRDPKYYNAEFIRSKL